MTLMTSTRHHLLSWLLVARLLHWMLNWKLMTSDPTPAAFIRLRHVPRLARQYIHSNKKGWKDEKATALLPRQLQLHPLSQHLSQHSHRCIAETVFFAHEMMSISIRAPFPYLAPAFICTSLMFGGRTYMTSMKYSKFWTPFPFVHISHWFSPLSPWNLPYITC